jgi:putative lipoic acid-binding regulatory protein
MEIDFSSLEAKLALSEWPAVYLFKFIVPNESENVALVTALFDESSDIVMHPSKNGKYMSVSAKEMMLDVDSIINKYKKASTIKGIISL